MADPGITVDVDVIADPGGLDRAMADWRAFARSEDVECGFFCEPEVVGLLAGVAGGNKLVLATVSRDRAPRAILPFQLREQTVRLGLGGWRFAGVRSRVLRLFDFDFAARGIDRMDALSAAVPAAADVSAPDVVYAANCLLREDGGKARDARLPGRSVLRNVQPTYVARLSATWDDYMSAFSSKRRYNLRREKRLLEESCERGLALRCYRTPEEIENFCGHFVRIWNSSWHGKIEGGAPAGKTFLRGVAERGWARSYLLCNGEEPIAAVLGFQYRGRYTYGWQTYDPAWQDRSPGTVATYLIFEHLFAHDRPDVLEFGFGYNQYKEVFGTDRELRGELWMAVSARGAGVVAGMKAGDMAYGLGRRALDRLGAFRKLRASRRRVKG